MLDHLKAQQAAQGRRETARLMLLVGLTLALATAMLGTRSCGAAGPQGPPDSAVLPPEVPEGAPPPVAVDRARLLAVGDGEPAHQDGDYARGALDYVLTLIGGAPAEIPRRTTPAALAALPFEEAAGRLYEVPGVVAEVTEREFRTSTQRLWTLAVQGPDGATFLAVKQGLASDPEGGRPRSAAGDAAWIRPGDPVVVRGIYLQRRTGTVGSLLLREPVPVLVLAKARRAEAPRPPIASPADADWTEVEDRFLAETRRWEEPTLFQVLQWAQEVGPDRLREDILAGKLPWKPWDREIFDRWEDEIEVRSGTQARPFTDGARGKVWQVQGLLGRVVYEGWETVPTNPQGVDHLYVYDIAAEHYTVYGTNIGLRNFSPFPPSAFPEIKGEKAEAVKFYGFFLKNHTYKSQFKSARKEGLADVTVPAFVVLYMEPVRITKDSRATWIVAGSLVLFAAAFYFVLVRGERREARRMEGYRRSLRQRMRAVGQGPVAPSGPRPPPPDGGAPPT